MMPCPLCGAHTSSATLEGHIFNAHPEHHVHLFPPMHLHPAFDMPPGLPHFCIPGAAMICGPTPRLPDFAMPMRVN